MHRRALLAGGLALAAGGWVGGPRAEPEAPDLAALEPLQAVIAGPEGLIVRVASRGCTAKADFSFYVDRRPGGGVAIAFGRKRVDVCKAAATHADLLFGYTELGVSADAPVTILNPVAAAPVVRRAPRSKR